jgi:hypothetical protein
VKCTLDDFKEKDPLKLSSENAENRKGNSPEGGAEPVVDGSVLWKALRPAVSVTPSSSSLDEMLE